MENLFSFCGPRGGGKETIITAILALVKEMSLSRIVPFTTRTIREGETHGKEYLFMKKMEVLEMEQKDILYSVRIGKECDDGHYFFGTLRSEFERHRNGIIDITVEGARTLSQYADNSLSFYLYADPEERCKRIMKRQNLSKHDALLLMANEPSPGTESTIDKLYPEFVILHNTDGKQVEIVDMAYTLIKEFLESKRQLTC